MLLFSGFYDGEVVHPTEKIDLPKNQNVTISFEQPRKLTKEEQELVDKRIAALESICGLLETEEEIRAFDESLSQHLKFKEVEV